NCKNTLPFVDRHRALIRNDVAILASNCAERFYTEEMKNRIERLAIFIPEVFKFDRLGLLSREKCEDALELRGVKSPSDVSKASRLQRQRLRGPPFLFVHRVEKIERLAAFGPLHVPM